MNRDSSQQDSLDQTGLEQVIALCDEFESSWRASRPVTIESVVARAPGAIRERLLRELIALEVELRRNSHETEAPAEYRRRFPDVADEVLQQIFTPGKSSAALRAIAEATRSLRRHRPHRQGRDGRRLSRARRRDRARPGVQGHATGTPGRPDAAPPFHRRGASHRPIAAPRDATDPRTRRTARRPPVLHHEAGARPDLARPLQGAIRPKPGATQVRGNLRASRPDGRLRPQQARHTPRPEAGKHNGGKVRRSAGHGLGRDESSRWRGNEVGRPQHATSHQLRPNRAYPRPRFEHRKRVQRSAPMRTCLPNRPRD